MGTKILDNIRGDVKVLITSLTGLEEGDEGFYVCKRFALSHIKYHRFLSVNGHETKRQISEITDKFFIHGKYEIAHTFQELVHSFLKNFDFEKHPQYDLQWSLLTFLINLSSETCNLNLKNVNQFINLSQTSLKETTESEEIDWAEYLKEGQADFFCNYESSSESDWSDIVNIRPKKGVLKENIVKNYMNCGTTSPIIQIPIFNNKITHCLDQENVCKQWLEKNVQNCWWYETDWIQYPINSEFFSTKLCQIWQRNVTESFKISRLISEYEACREVIWMLQTPVHMVLFGEMNSTFFIRDSISIPSLTVTAFNRILSPFCDYFSMIRDLEHFGQSLYLYSHEPDYLSTSPPPLTYEIYNATLLQHLLQIKNGICNVEKCILKQDNCVTLLSISRDLRTYLQEIKILYEVHQSVIHDWKVTSNWNCTVKLLSGLYFQIENCSNKRQIYICSTLYLSSLTVYLNIIDLWLSEGRLEDWREEFLISRSTGESAKDNSTQCEKFIVREIDQMCAVDPLIKRLLNKVYQMGRNIELLVTLGRMPNLWDMEKNAAGVRKSLSDEFNEKFLFELSNCIDACRTDSCPTLGFKRTANMLREVLDADMDRNVIQQVSTIGNPFLLKAFDNVLPIDLCEEDTIDGKSEMPQIYNAREKRLQKMLKPIFPIRKIIECTLNKILDTRLSRASKLVKDILMQEYKLGEHLKLMRSVYMMEISHVMNKFCFQLFFEIENNIMWNNSAFLTCIFEEALSQKWSDLSSRWSITVGAIRKYTVLEAVDSITLHYAIGWPINMLLNDFTLTKYNNIFRFHLKLKWALSTLSNLRFAGSRSVKITDTLQQFYIKRLESLRFWLLHTISSIHTYLCSQVFQSLSYMFQKALSQADNLDTIITIHNEYLEKVNEHSFQTRKFDELRQIISSLLKMCVHIREKWQRGYKALNVQELDMLEKNYVKYHTHIAFILNNAIHQTNDDYLTSLESAFTYNMPCTQT